MRRILGIVGLSLFASACGLQALGCLSPPTVGVTTDCDLYPHVGCSSNSGMGGSMSGSTSGSGMPATCGDGILNGNETDLDCGGACPAKCADTKGCVVGGDCISGVCDMVMKTCSPPTCMDMVKNGTETDVDCGSNCAALNPPQKCSSGKGCTSATDCKSDTCTMNLCVATCSDIEKNQDETDVDCGGMTCTPCNASKNCVVPSDCKSNVCTGGKCQVPTCMDGVQNQGESDVDCGGPTCNSCGSGKKCNDAGDCVSNVCVSGDGGKVCQ